MPGSPPASPDTAPLPAQSAARSARWGSTLAAGLAIAGMLVPEAVVLSVESSDYLDVTALEALQELHAHLARRGLALLLARIKDPPRAALERVGLTQIPLYWSVDDAVRAATAPTYPTETFNIGKTSPGQA